MVKAKITLSGIVQAAPDDLKRLEAESPDDLMRTMLVQGVKIEKTIEVIKPEKKGK